MDRVKKAILLAATLAIVPCASADETTFCTRYIRSLPFTITTQAHYCLDRNLATAITSGAAITVNADFVLLDLNNFRLSGSAAGTGTLAIGIHANNRSHLTIRNGNIRGFAYGILVEGDGITSARNVTVENNVARREHRGRDHRLWKRLQHPQQPGLQHRRHHQHVGVQLWAATADHDRHLDPGQRNTLGCETGGYGEVLGNTVVNTFPDGLSGCRPHHLHHAGFNGIVAHNRVMNQKPSIVYPAIVGTVCRDNTVVDIAGAGYNCVQFVGINSDH